MSIEQDRTHTTRSEQMWTIWEENSHLEEKKDKEIAVHLGKLNLSNRKSISGKLGYELYSLLGSFDVIDAGITSGSISSVE